jgi:hypothetical protein
MFCVFLPADISGCLYLVSHALMVKGVELLHDGKAHPYRLVVDANADFI